MKRTLNLLFFFFSSEKMSRSIRRGFYKLRRRRHYRAPRVERKQCTARDRADSMATGQWHAVEEKQSAFRAHSNALMRYFQSEDAFQVRLGLCCPDGECYLCQVYPELVDQRERRDRTHCGL
jgi:hypothetical protein